MAQDDMIYELTLKNGSLYFVIPEQFNQWLNERGEQVSSNFSGRLNQLNTYMVSLGLTVLAKDWTMEDR
jgi:hypothetical protein